MVANERINDKRVCVVDHGLFPGWATRLAREFGEVYYHNRSWKSLMPVSNDLYVGRGFDGVTVLKNLWDSKDKIDLFVFTWLYDGDLQLELQRQGKRVWGPRKGEDLELYRPETKELMKRMGMPVGQYEVVVGIDNLVACLKDRRNVHVKISLTRGDTETFGVASLEEVMPKIRELQHRLDLIGNEMQFVVEEDIGGKSDGDVVEIGYDGWSVDGQFPSMAMHGVEHKDEFYLMALLDYRKLDFNIRVVNDWLAPALKDFGYRGFLHTEIRVPEDERPYLIDITTRSGDPPGHSMMEAVSNWGEIMWHGANGKLVPPEPEFKYMAQAAIESEFASKNFVCLRFPEEIRRWVNLSHHARVNGCDVSIPTPYEFTSIGWVSGGGDSIEEAIGNCMANASQVSGYGVKIKTDKAQQVVDEIKKGEELGVNFTDDPIPESVHA